MNSKKSIVDPDIDDLVTTIEIDNPLERLNQIVQLSEKFPLDDQDPSVDLWEKLKEAIIDDQHPKHHKVLAALLTEGLTDEDYDTYVRERLSQGLDDVRDARGVVERVKAVRDTVKDIVQEGVDRVKSAIRDF